ncbi:MAG: hypothetical protein A2096_11960 [Spirochaetes bacterium GWF1_41_5]|nr:MAG: hypothetical protein A2096_11960 [Spirochaetes bacterium GWF1_41_5]HBE00988.1 hypothetical protein [Spirochaetia bacterium]
MTEKKIIKFTPYKFPEAEINLFIAEKNLSQAPVIHYNRPNTYEIGYIFSGQGSYFINNRFYPIRRGMVFFINDCDFHSLQLESKNIHKAHLCFSGIFLCRIEKMLSTDFSAFFRERSRNSNYHLQLNNEAAALFEFLISRLSYELEKRRQDFLMMINIIMCEILLLLKRNNSPGSLLKYHVYKDSAQRIVLSAVNIIEQNIGSALSLVSLASQIRVTPAYLSRIFKETLGVALSHYITGTRLNLAKDLLKNSNKKILEIAYESGFNDLSTFNRAFKKNIRISPLRYREMHRPDIKMKRSMFV